MENIVTFEIMDNHLGHLAGKIKDVSGFEKADFKYIYKNAMTTEFNFFYETEHYYYQIF